MGKIATRSTLIFLATILIMNIPYGSTAEPVGGITIGSLSVYVSVDDSFVRTTTSFTLMNGNEHTSEYEFRFSIPDDAFLTNLTAEMNGTRYYGQVKEDEAAQQEYQEAVESGKSAIKIEKYSVSSFGMSLNLLAGKDMAISYRYHQFLIKELGGYNVFLRPSSLLPQGISSDISVSFAVNSTTMISAATVENLGANTINYEETDRITSSAFITGGDLSKEISLTYETVDTGTEGIMQFHNEGEITYFLHTFAPGMEQLGDRSLDKDIVFIVDRSGSMSGEKMKQTKEAFHLIVDALSGETDRFNIISFSSGYELWKDELQVPDGDTVEEADNWIDGLSATGGTNIIEALEKGLDILTGDSSRMKIIVFLTDGDPTAGYIQSTASICTTILEKNTAKISIFSLGVGSDMDFDFLKKLSFQNYARAYRIDDNQDISEQIAHFYETISTPLIYRLNMGYDNAGSVYQRQAPYMFKGQEHLVLGMVNDASKDVKFAGTGVTVNGTTTFSGEFAPANDDKSYIAQLWAFMHIRWCEERMVMGETPETGNATSDSTYKDEIIHTATKYQIVTEYTTMIMVVEEEVKEKEEKADDDGDDDNDVPPDVWEEVVAHDPDDQDSLTYDSGGGDEGISNAPPREDNSKWTDDDIGDDDGDGYPTDPEKKDKGEADSALSMDDSSSGTCLIVIGIFVVILVIGVLVVTGVVKSRRQRDRNLTGMRNDIYEFVKHNPGEHFSSIMYEFDTSPSSITYHLNLLEKGGRVISHKDSKFKRYYANVDGVFGGGELRDCIGGQEYKEIVSALKGDRAVRIVRYIMENPGCTQKEISKDIGINPSTVNWHMNKLKASKIVSLKKKGKFNLYNVPDSDTISKTLGILDNGNGNT